MMCRLKGETDTPGAGEIRGRELGRSLPGRFAAGCARNPSFRGTGRMLCSDLAARLARHKQPLRPDLLVAEMRISHDSNTEPFGHSAAWYMYV